MISKTHRGIGRILTPPLLALTAFAATGCSSAELAGPGVAASPAPTGPRPTLIEFTKGSCPACKQMEPIIDSVKTHYARSLTVRFVHILKNRKEKEKYRIAFVPTQVFLDPKGKEIYRHIGVISEERIVNKWKDLGYSL